MNGFIIEENVLIQYTGVDQHVVIPDGITAIGRGAFVENKELISVVIPDSVTAIEDHAFHSCHSLESIVIPNSVTRMGTYEHSYFEDCKSLKSVVLSENIQKIGTDAFRNCSALESITIPQGVTELYNHAFKGCTALKEINLPESLTTVYEGAFDDTPWAKEQGEFVIGNGTLLFYTGKDKHVVVPDGVTRINPWAFPYSLKLESLVIPEGVATICDDIIGRRGLKEITLAPSVVAIESGAVKKKTDPNLIVKCGEKLFSAIHADTRMTMCQRWLRDELTLEPYQEAAVTKAIARLRDKLFAKIAGDDDTQLSRLLACGKVKPEQIDAYFNAVNDQKHPRMLALLLEAQQNGVPKKAEAKLEALSLDADSSTRKEWEKVYRLKEDERGFILAKYKGMDKKPEIPASIDGKPVYAIANNAFKGNENLEEIFIPSCIESIGSSAFEDCTSLVHIMFSEGLKVIGKRAFYNCPSLTGDLCLPEGLVELSPNAFGIKFVSGRPQRHHIPVCHIPASLRKFVDIGASYSDYHFHGTNIELDSEDPIGEGLKIYVIKGSALADRVKRSLFGDINTVIEVDE